MNLELTEDQQLLDDTLRGFFDRHAGMDRVRTLDGSVDADLPATLASNGFLDVMRDAGPIEALLVTERAAQAVACAPVAARVLIGPLAGIEDLPNTVGLVGSTSGLVRYAGSCEAYLVLAEDGGSASLASADDVDVEMVDSPGGYPLGRVRVRRSEPLPDADALRRAWQVAIAAEVGATALAAVSFTADHVRDRHQFGRPIGSFQAVQHRLARSFSMANATQWMARRGGWHATDEFLTATAATFACETAQGTYDSCHQVTGGIGITNEYGLVNWTMRLLVLQRELGGGRAHARRVAQVRRAAA